MQNVLSFGHFNDLKITLKFLPPTGFRRYQAEERWLVVCMHTIPAAHLKLKRHYTQIIVLMM